MLEKFKCFLRVLIALLLTCASIVNETFSDDSVAKQAVINGTSFNVANGLEFELVADKSLVKWPIVADWDDRGRLVVAESGGVAKPVKDHNKQGLHKIIRLIDLDSDGFFDKRLLAADGLGFPEGVLCLGNTILVSIPPKILKLTDVDGDGFCERQETWFDGQTITGCANDLHGPYFGRDGKIYWCKGAFAEQKHTLADGSDFRSSAAHLYRSNEDGSQLEVVMTGGMDNPVEMAFIPEGEKFFTSTFLQHPNQGLRDGIAHAVYGGVFGKDHHVLEGHLRTGDLMPVMTQLGPAAPSGLIYLDNNLLSPSNQTPTLCSALFNLHKVCAHQLQIDASTYTTTDQDLISTERVDFHPTDVIEDADGSLLVLDTGGWYDLCCPTSRIDQKTAAGGIYRISSPLTKKRLGKLKTEEKKTTQLSYQKLIDPRPWIRREAVRELGHKDDRLVDLATKQISSTDIPVMTKLHYVWALCATATPDSLEVCHGLLDSDESSIVKAACHAIALHNYQEAKTKLERLINHGDASICRAAAEALGRLGDEDSINAILESAHLNSSDRFVKHSLIYALIEIVRDKSNLTLPQKNLKAHQLATVITVATQVKQTANLDRSTLLLALQSDDLELQRAAMNAIRKNPEIAIDSKKHLKAIWSAEDATENNRIVVFNILQSVKEEPEFRPMINQMISEAGLASFKEQIFYAKNLSAVAPANADADWIDAVMRWLENSKSAVRNEIAKSLASNKVKDVNDYQQKLDAIAQSEQDIETKVTLITARPRHDQPLTRLLEVELLKYLSSDVNTIRVLSHQALRKFRLSDEAAESLAMTIQDHYPHELPAIIEAIAKTRDEDSIIYTLNALANLPSATTLPSGFLNSTFQNPSALIRRNLDATNTLLEKRSRETKQSLEATLLKLNGGDPVKGLQLFRSSKLGCESCHKMGYRGKDIGPDLTRIGGTRTKEAILEAIIEPSNRIEQGYTTTKVLTFDGRILNGIVIKETKDWITLRLDADRSETIQKDEIEIQEPSETSIMPDGLVKLLTDQELADLMAFLTSAK